MGKMEPLTDTQQLEEYLDAVIDYYNHIYNSATMAIRDNLSDQHNSSLIMLALANIILLYVTLANGFFTTLIQTQNLAIQAATATNSTNSTSLSEIKNLPNVMSSSVNYLVQLAGIGMTVMLIIILAIMWQIYTANKKNKSIQKDANEILGNLYWFKTHLGTDKEKIVPLVKKIETKDITHIPVFCTELRGIRISTEESPAYAERISLQQIPRIF
jgi:hypothetical protein